MADNIVTREQAARSPIDGFVNGTTNETGASASTKAALESTLTSGDYIARVITLTNNYLKVKWYLNNKPFTVYKSKNYTTQKAQQYLQSMIDIAAGTVAPTSVDVTPATSSGAAASTVQLTATVSPAQANQGVYWSTSDATKATVSESGLVTRVATGSAVITARTKSLPEFTDTATITIS